MNIFISQRRTRPSFTGRRGFDSLQICV